MRLPLWIVAPWLASAAVWSVISSCVLDVPEPDDGPAVRLVARWDPGACGDPHRVVLELEDEQGEEIRGSTPCTTGSLILGAPAFGVYRGRVYAWELGEPIRSIVPVMIALDAGVVHWQLTTPR